MKEKIRSNFLILFMCLFAVLLMPSDYVMADTGNSLTDLFNTSAFQGSWAIFDEMNVIGRFMCWIISAFSLIGIFTVGLRLMCSLLYLSGKTIWDNVAEIKSAEKDSGLIGYGRGGLTSLLKGGGSSSFNKNGGGLDIIINFGLGLLPNIKEYSEYGQNQKMQIKGLDAESDTVTSYLLKSALSYIMIIFAFTMGFNGTLWQAYGKVVEGMSSFAGHVVDVKLDSVVDGVCNQFGRYQFGYEDSGTPLGVWEQSMANNIYAQVLTKSEDKAKTEVKQALGEAIDKNVMPQVELICLDAIYGNMTVAKFKESYGEDTADNIGLSKAKDSENVAQALWQYDKSADEKDKDRFGDSSLAKAALSKMEKYGCAPTEAQVKNIVGDVVINKTAQYTASVNVPLDQFFSMASSGYYLHVYAYKKANADETMYFHILNKDETSGTKGATGSIQTVGEE